MFPFLLWEEPMPKVILGSPRHSSAVTREAGIGASCYHLASSGCYLPPVYSQEPVSQTSLGENSLPQVQYQLWPHPQLPGLCVV